MSEHVEAVRRIWTPESEIQEVILNLDPRTELDLQFRDYLHRTIEQKGPVTLLLGTNGKILENQGTLRWEIITYEPLPGIVGRREISLWVEK